ncbi:MAG: hypothetical protein NT121_12675 [Chloroflexi bacterium]|nr:hypothetical protein [Chloroflexota bacterium]
MFKIIFRIIVILLVAALVSGGLYALVQSSGTNNLAERPEHQFENQNAGRTGSQPDQFREHGEERNAFSFGRGLIGVLGSLLKVGVIVFIVLQVQKMLSKKSRQNTSSPA